MTCVTREFCNSRPAQSLMLSRFSNGQQNRLIFNTADPYTKTCYMDYPSQIDPSKIGGTYKFTFDHSCMTITDSGPYKY